MPQAPQNRRRRCLRQTDGAERSPSGPRARPRLLCGFGCPCCPPPPPPPLETSFTEAAASVGSVGRPRHSLAVQAAALDGNRDLPYVDTHVHLEMVLQKLQWYESAPSSLEPEWACLTEEEQRCWRMLGWTQSVWDNGRKGKNPLWFRSWAFLTAAQRAAAEALGWTETSWEGFEWLLPEHGDWSALDAETQKHLRVLGEDADSWHDMFGANNPAGMCMGGDMREWTELSLEEQLAATTLGFTPQSWDMNEMADVHGYVADFCGSGFEAVVTQGCDSDSIEPCLKLALAHPRVFASFGCHPKNAWLYEEEGMEARMLAAFHKCGRKAIAWGEVGLDFSNMRYGDEEGYRRQQIEVFERQIELALSLEMPMVLHIRDAADESLELMKKRVPKHWKAHIHSYLGPAWFVPAVLEYFPNFYFGVTGTASMGGDGQRMARQVPLERLLLETDGPYMAPRGTSFNHPGQIPLIARLIAKARGCDAAEVATKARENARAMYGV